jgi:cytidylate kinase
VPRCKKSGVIAVDGPAGAGKSTVARRLADCLGYLYLDTGAMYRALAYKALRRGIDLRDESAVAELLSESTIELYPRARGQVNVILDGHDVTQSLRTPEINAIVSIVAEFPSVRQDMVDRQRKIAQPGAIVMDGRDIGTFVLPDADVKFFLTASLEERAHRRYEELRRLGFGVSLRAVQEEIEHRDALDSRRRYAPLARAEDAILLDTTKMEVEEVVAQMLAICCQRLS